LGIAKLGLGIVLKVKHILVSIYYILLTEQRYYVLMP
jgi:hypothetical protein